MSKICGICGEDCSDRPRVKDRHGRYYCKACASERARADDDAAPGVAAGAAGGAVGAAAAAALPEDPDTFELDNADPGARPLPIEMLDNTEPTRNCPMCFRSMPRDAKICVSCGYDPEKGIQSSTKIVKKAGKGWTKRTRGYRCDNCGYDLAGLPEPVCPECGTRVDLSRRARLDEQIRSQTFHMEYKKPMVWFAIGFVIVGIALAVKGEPMGFLGYAILLVMQLPFMLLGLWLCQKTFLGEIGTIPLNTVRIASALALGNAVDEILPISFFFITPGMIVYLVVLMDLFDIDLSDAIWAAVIMFLAKIGATLLAVYAMVQYLGISI
ncbi:MAG: zinc ribbon domain-containing protein [Planctomycetota bacterium]|nr:zinc ribbon domain-containing protein [Planctomycetota bacterium]